MNKNVVTWQRNHKKYMEISLKVNVSKIIARLSFILNIIELKKQKKKKQKQPFEKLDFEIVAVEILKCRQPVTIWTESMENASK